MKSINNDTARTLHLWVSGLEETGGIQHYSSCCLQALKELFPRTQIRVFSKNDLRRSANSLQHVFGRRHGMLRTAEFILSGFKWAWRENPDFILSTHPHFMKVMGPLIQLGIPCLTAAHGIETWGRMGGWYGQSLRRATGILPVSSFTRDVISREALVQDACMRVVPNTFREDMFFPGPKSVELLQRYGLRADQPVLFTVARLSASERYKGQDQILLSLPLLIREFPNISYLIGGRGDDELRLRQLASDLRVEKQVIFAGYIPETELADHYRLADLYVMPSTGEGFGIVFLESLACGRACIVGNQDASPEAIDQGRLGFIVPPREPEAIATAIRRFLLRDHGQPWLHDPAFLHREVVRLYGYKAFQYSLSRALTALL